jgi:hypothetical protein
LRFADAAARSGEGCDHLGERGGQAAGSENPQWFGSHWARQDGGCDGEQE